MGQTNPQLSARPETHQPIHTDKDQHQTNQILTAIAVQDKDSPITNSPTTDTLNTKALTNLPWWRRTGSNRRPPACKAGALPAELRPLRKRLTKTWWAREDLNLRPHAYQACALTN